MLGTYTNQKKFREFTYKMDFGTTKVTVSYSQN